ncbi:MAG: hypothetical protein GF364_00845 [Candidatus Lokiarchaeota archaeon]|nr:hypothetical protein [Candidatus Lokiarchaeota archaeon]
MIVWSRTTKDFGVTEGNVTKRSKVWFKCGNCGKEYVLSYKTIIERGRCERNKCKFCANQFLTETQRETRKNSYVKKCRENYTEEKKRKLNQYYLKSWKTLVTRRVLTIEDKHGTCDITCEYVATMLKNQDYKCKLSGVQLTHTKSLNSMSIDRIDNNLGHIKNNVQLICRGLNIAKNKHTNNNIIQFLDCLCNKRKFVPEKFSRDYLSSVRRNSEQRDRRKQLDNDLTTDILVDIYKQQKGLCTITGLPLACYPHPCFSCSIDRLDNNLGHTVDNIHLVLKCINRAKSRFTINQVNTWLEDVRSCYGNLD